MVVVEEQEHSVATEYVTLLSQFLVQKSVMLGEKFNQLPKNVHGCTDALLKCGGMVGSLDNKPIKTVLWRLGNYLKKSCRGMWRMLPSKEIPNYFVGL